MGEQAGKGRQERAGQGDRYEYMTGVILEYLEQELGALVRAEEMTAEIGAGAKEK